MYFDTLDFQCLHDNLNGLSERRKYRIRWYGDFSGTIKKPVLEIKIKKSFLGTKEQYFLNEFTIDNEFTWDSLRNALRSSGLPERVEKEITSLVPVVFNRYKRKYYTSPDKKFRITIDDKLCFYLAENTFNCHTLKKKTDNSVVLELKYGVGNEVLASNVSIKFPFRMTKNSKYITGVSKFFEITI